MRTRNFFLVIIVSLAMVWACKKDSSGTNKNEVSIEGMAFNPSTITAKTNTTITWINKDAVDHTVTSNDGLFDSGALVKNGSYSYTFTTAGTYNYHCSIHPNMTGKVVIQQSTTTNTSSGY